MTDSKEIYKKLPADIKAEKNYCFSDQGECMMPAREHGTHRVFPVNKIERDAWKLVNL